MIALIVAIGLRTVLGAPCCMDGLGHAQVSDANAHSEHHLHKAALTEGAGHEHSEHGDSPTANPCCSACGPTLAPKPAQIALINTPRILPQPTAIRALATRPPFPAYEATGPPLLS
ncbi:MAG: hypothetical protein AAF941_10170 [Pseudomonadota bacterium]